jgi:hypothetical protein
MYLPLPIPGAENEKMNVMVSSAGQLGEESYLRFDLMWGGAWDSKLPKPISDAAAIGVKLHMSDGTTVLPKRSLPGWIGAGSGGVTYSLMYTFPWGRNTLDESWIELDAAGQIYWIEMPYGFARNPADAELTDPGRGQPQFPPTMKALGDKDTLVPWLHVDYDLGEIQNHWRLSLELSNPSDAHAEAILYRDDTEVGKSMNLWKLDSPRMAMEIQMSGGGVLKGFETAIRRHDDGLRRSDVYSFNRDASPEMGRDWGTVVVQVDDERYSRRIPSSLFKYLHGMTDPGNKKRLAVPTGQ